jgi:hypothetical protein
MQDHSHRLLFLAATGAMCAVISYGSRTVPNLLLSDDRAGTGATIATKAFVRAANFAPSEPPAAADEPAANSLPQSTATVVPNRTSCPDAGANALLSPPAINGVMGKPTPAERSAAATRPITDAALGTGSSCPIASQGEISARSPAPAADIPHPIVANTPGRTATHP